MDESRFEQNLAAYDQWKSTLINTIQSFQHWLDDHGLNEADLDLKIFETLEVLRQDRLTLAVVAEFSRGKSELINALFFADYGRRLLPSTAGRTTMCPTEIFWDPESTSPYIQLLPIATRLEDISLRDLKLDHTRWTRTKLNLDDPEQVAQALSEVLRTTRVSVGEARELGLYNPEYQANATKEPTEVDIPKWRHALINFPHALLKRGLTILDTPGLNALGAEPELTLGMLPQAHAVIFLLAADTGVTRTDLDVWQHHIRGFRSDRRKGLIVVLNKIDTLWDELSNEAAVQEAIAKQKEATARILGVDERLVFPASAQKGLVAKIRQNRTLLRRSRLGELEHYLSEDLLKQKHAIIHETVCRELGDLIEQSRTTISDRLDACRVEIEELTALRGKNRNVVENMMRKLRVEQDEHHRAVSEFQASSKMLALQGRELIAALDLDELDRYIGETRRNMIGSWTTSQLKANMGEFLKRVRNDMLGVVEQNERTRRLIRTIYRRFEEKHALEGIALPKMFSIIEYRVQLELLYQEAEEFRRSTKTTLTEQGIVVRKFFVTMVSRARDIFVRAHTECDRWLTEALKPLRRSIRERKRGVEKRLDSLRRVHQSMDTLESRIADLRREQQALENDLNTLRNMHTTLTGTRPMARNDRPRPRLVAS
ncbi:MAG: dynamin family protein [Chromatiales bacterium]|nr:dynamin family protein [Chromatiales bacterium]